MNDSTELPSLTDDELKNALDGLFAWDSGSTDSGIRDERLRQRCIKELTLRLADSDGRLFMSRLLRDMWLTETALVVGYSYEDLIAFVRWLDERMSVELGI